MKVETEIEFEMTRVPNFLRIKGSRETIDIGMLTNEGIEEYAQSWVMALRDNWKKRKSEQLSNEH